MKSKFFVLSLLIATCIYSCKDDPKSPAHCSNGVFDDNEMGLDCGGDCPDCEEDDYYFDITYDGTQYFYDTDVLQAGSSGPYEFGGYVLEAGLLGPSLSFQLYFDDTVQTLNLDNAIEGQRFYFNHYSGPLPLAEISHNFSVFSPYYYSDKGLDSSQYFVDISEVIFLYRDSILFDFNVYAVRGTFKTSIETSSGGYSDATGSFFMQCTHGNY